MNEYLLLMHSDVADAQVAGDPDRWAHYLTGLRQTGRFDGGSEIGRGACFRRGQESALATSPVTGFLRVRADSLEQARQFLVGNPVYDAGGTVEIRELPRS